jgi:hypothetical protein
LTPSGQPLKIARMARPKSSPTPEPKPRPERDPVAELALAVAAMRAEQAEIRTTLAALARQAQPSSPAAPAADLAQRYHELALASLARPSPAPDRTVELELVTSILPLLLDRLIPRPPSPVMEVLETLAPTAFRFLAPMFGGAESPAPAPAAPPPLKLVD